MKTPTFNSLSRLITGSLIAVTALLALPNAAHADRDDQRDKGSRHDKGSDHDKGGRNEKHDGKDTTASVQRALARRGYYKGEIDGNLGRGTRGAIARYQKRNDLRVTGDVDQSLLRSLEIR